MIFWLIHTERIWSRYYYENTMQNWHRLGFFAEIGKFTKDLLVGNWNLTVGGKYAYSFYSGEKKTKIRILFDNIWWTIRFKEVNVDYYLYGMDCKSCCMRDYISYSEFRILRNILNIRKHEIRTNTKYCFNYLAIPRDKFVWGQFCKSLGVSHPETYALTNRNRVWWIGFAKETYEPFDSFKIIESLDAFCKEIAGGGGRKAFSLKIDHGKVTAAGNIVSLAELQKLFEHEQYIIQQRIDQHPLLSELYPHSLNTMRMMSFLHDDGEVEIIDSRLRTGSKGNKVDNWGLGGFQIGMDHRTGVLKDWGMYKPGYGGRVERFHPDTGFEFKGFKVPYYEAAVEMVKKLHRANYGISSSGWDIAISPNGPVCIEMTEDWEIPMTQVYHGGYRDEFYRLHGKALEIKLRRL